LRDVVIEDRHSMVVAGTHGKTTTTSMLAWVCEQAGLQPGFLIGGIPNNFSSSFQNPKADTWVIEGDEYDTAFFAKVPKFLYYKPRSVILTSIEFDHADIYKDLQDVLQAFQSLLEIIPQEEGLLVYNAEDPNIPKVLPTYSGKTLSYGFHHGDWTLADLQFRREGLDFEVRHRGKREDQLFLPMFGQYNATNALAVYALVKELGLKVDLKQAFAAFKGVKRRQELIGEPHGIQVIEDFAHHPTAVASTIESFQRREGRGQLIVIFEPRSNTSRRRVFQEAYRKALAGAEHLFVCEPQSGTQPLKADDLLDVAVLVQGRVGVGRTFQKVEDILPDVKALAQPGDTVLIMSNGAFQGIYQKILETL
jgi:UDP-N-acetylmuramate: L-alanyl-gamma-D-glutamyl-meso-diaminopimelate ligase